MGLGMVPEVEVDVAWHWTRGLSGSLHCPLMLSSSRGRRGIADAGKAGPVPLGNSHGSSGFAHSNESQFICLSECHCVFAHS